LIVAEYLPEARWQRCTVHFYRNVFSHVPKAKVREVARMLKAIHAQESRDTAIEKADAVVTSLRAVRLNKAADLVEAKIHEYGSAARGETSTHRSRRRMIESAKDSRHYPSRF